MNFHWQQGNETLRIERHFKCSVSSKQGKESETVNEHQESKSLCWHDIRCTRLFFSHLKSWIIQNPVHSPWKSENEFLLVFLVHELGVVAISRHLLYHVVNQNLNQGGRARSVKHEV